MISPEHPFVPSSRLWGLAGSLFLHGLCAAAFFWAAPWDAKGAASPLISTGGAIEVTLVSAAQETSHAPSRTDRGLSNPPPVAQTSELAEAVSPTSPPPPGGERGGEAQRSAPQEDGSAAAIDPAVGADYRQRLLAHIQPFRHYPAQVQSADVKGIVQLIFMVDQGGGVMGVWVKSSSGFDVLDAEAVATILRAQPMPRVPPGLPSPLTVQLPVSFSPS